MINIIKLTLLLTILLLIGCGEANNPEPTTPLKPLFQTHIDLPDENWPPKESNITQSVDLSDFNLPSINNISQTVIGKANIVGTISLIASNGKRINGAYSNIYIKNIIDPQGKVFGNFLESAISDSNGKFEFRKIPNGRYKVSGSLDCGVECGYDTNKTITLSKIVMLDRNSTYSVNISNAIQRVEP